VAAGLVRRGDTGRGATGLVPRRALSRAPTANRPSPGTFDRRASV